MKSLKSLLMSFCFHPKLEAWIKTNKTLLLKNLKVDILLNMDQETWKYYQIHRWKIEKKLFKTILSEKWKICGLYSHGNFSYKLQKLMKKLEEMFNFDPEQIKSLLNGQLMAWKWWKLDKIRKNIMWRMTQMMTDRRNLKQ